MKELPIRPSLEHLRAQAHDLLRGFRADLPDAITFVGRNFPNPPVDFGLQEAQTAVAREYGYLSWTALKREVDRRTGDLVGNAVDALWAYGPHDSVPEPSDLDHPSVRLMRGERPDIDPVAPMGPRNVAPLVYVCFSRLNRNPEYQLALAKTAQYLIDRGADANGGYCEPETPNDLYSVLYAACGRVNSAPLTEVLLRAGASSDDGESFYHVTEWADHACLRLLLAYGGNPDTVNVLAHMLDRPDMEGLHILLEGGARPGPDVIPHALARGRTWPYVELLLEFGADATARDRSGFTPQEMAWMAGDIETAERFAERHPQPLSPAMEAIRRAVRHERVEGRPVTRLEDGWAVELAAERNDTVALRILLDAGFDPEGYEPYHQDRLALHQACFAGHAESVRILVDAGASLTRRDRMYNGYPLGWLLHGSPHHADASRHIACAKILLDAGHPMRTLARPGDPAFLYPVGHPEVLRYLISRGAIHGDPE